MMGNGVLEAVRRVVVPDVSAREWTALSWQIRGPFRKCGSLGKSGRSVPHLLARSDALAHLAGMHPQTDGRSGAAVARYPITSSRSIGFSAQITLIEVNPGRKRRNHDLCAQFEVM